MFTGLIEHIGILKEIQTIDTSESGGNAYSFTISNAEPILDDCKLGDSIAVNGTCLTVTSFNKDEFKVTLAPETLRRTNLGDLKVGDKVNLERATLGLSRFGGHFIQGHVDATVTIKSITQEETSIWYKFQAPSELLKYIVEKGYIALDGTSLTICDVNDIENTFTIMMIPYTQSKVIMPSKKVGDKVNVEVDMLGKYVHKIVEASFKGNEENSWLKEMIEKVVKEQLDKRQL